MDLQVGKYDVGGQLVSKSDACLIYERAAHLMNRVERIRTRGQKMVRINKKRYMRSWRDMELEKNALRHSIVGRISDFAS